MMFRNKKTQRMVAAVISIGLVGIMLLSLLVAAI